MIDTYLKANGFQQTIQQVQNQLSTDGCCTSKSAYVDYSANSIHYLSDIIRIFGDLGVGYAEQHYTINESPIIKIEAYVDIQRPNAFTTNYTIPTNIKNEKENNKMTNMFDSFNGMFGKLGAGLCRLSMNGGIAVKTSNGYKSYNTKTGRLVNCSNFVFDMGDEMFFIIPTNKVEAGDIIMVAGRPRCVIKKDKTTITVINYEDSTIETILPERHIFMGNTYFYGKVVSMFGDDITGGGKKGMNKIMKFMMLSEMMKGGANGNQGNPFGAVMPFMLMNGNMGDLFGGIFNFDDEESDAENEENEDEEPEAEN